MKLFEIIQWCDENGIKLNDADFRTNQDEIFGSESEIKLKLDSPSGLIFIEPAEG